MILLFMIELENKKNKIRVSCSIDLKYKKKQSSFNATKLLCFFNSLIWNYSQYSINVPQPNWSKAPLFVP